MKYLVHPETNDIAICETDATVPACLAAGYEISTYERVRAAWQARDRAILARIHNRPVAPPEPAQRATGGIFPGAPQKALTVRR